MDSAAASRLIRLQIPADEQHVALARMAAAAVGSQIGFDVDGVDELRLATGELVNVLVEHGQDVGGSPVDLVLTWTDDEVRVDGSVGDAGANGAVEVAAADDEDALDLLTRRILDGVADAYEVGRGVGHIVKRRNTE